MGRETSMSMIRGLALIMVMIAGMACGGGGGADPVSAPEAIQDAVAAANDIDQTLEVQTSSGSIQDIRSRIPEVFPLYQDLLDGDEESIRYVRDCFQGTPDFDGDITLVIYALVLEDLNDRDSVPALRMFLEDNINGDLMWAPHAVTHALKVLTGDTDREDSCYYTGIQMQVTASGTGTKSVSTAKSETKASCLRQYVLVDGNGNPLTYVDGKGATRTAVVYGTEFATDRLTDAYRQHYMALVADGQGTYVNDDPEFPGSPSKQFNCAGYAFRSFNGGKRWVSEPSMMFDVLIRAGQLVEVGENEAQPGDKVFYFQPGKPLPGHVAEVSRIEEGLLSNAITVRNADSQSGLWEADIDASYFTGNGLAAAKYTSRKVYRWAHGSPPDVMVDPATAGNDAYCTDQDVDYVYASVNIYETYSTTIAEYGDACAAGMSTIWDGVRDVVLDNIPSMIVSVGGTELDFQDQLTIAFHPGLQGPGTYTRLGEFSDLKDGVDVGITFVTKSLYDEGNPSALVCFYPVSGTVALDEVGTRIGDRISGSFDVSVVGKRTHCVGDDCDREETLKGTIVGSFEGVLSDYDGPGL